jgi:hypothetical protein
MVARSLWNRLADEQCLNFESTQGRKGKQKNCPQVILLSQKISVLSEKYHLDGGETNLGASSIPELTSAAGMTRRAAEPAAKAKGRDAEAGAGFTAGAQAEELPDTAGSDSGCSDARLRDERDCGTK